MRINDILTFGSKPVLISQIDEILANKNVTMQGNNVNSPGGLLVLTNEGKIPENTDIQHIFYIGDTFPSADIKKNSLYVSSTGESRATDDNAEYINISLQVVTDFSTVSDDTVATSQAIKTYVDNSIANIATETSGVLSAYATIEYVDNKVANISTDVQHIFYVEDFPEVSSAVANSIYVNKNTKESRIFDGTEFASISLKTVTDFSTVSNDTLATTQAISSFVDEKISNIDIPSTDLSNYYNKTETDSKIDEKIATAISTTYKPAGSTLFASLPPLSAENVGKVYNIIDEFTTTEDFMEGAGAKYPVGTNVVCIDSDDAGTYKWDVLAGIIDLSEYETTESITEKLNNKVDKVPGSSLVEDTDIAKLKGLANIKSVASEELNIDGESGELSIVAITSDKVTGLADTLNNKVDKEVGKTLIEETLITKLQGMTEIKGVSGELEIGAENKILGVKAIEQSKITGLPDALAAKLTGVTVGTTPLEVSDGVVTIPIATAELLGVVKSSAAENNITIAADGIMSVHSLNLDKLVQTPGTEIILNGGNAAPVKGE